MNELDIQQGNDEALRELALFAGAGGGILGSELLGWKTICAVERDAYASQVLAQRQNDGILRSFPIWSDVKTFDGRPWKGIIDVISGGFPCQPHSLSGKRKGMQDDRWLWPEIKRIQKECAARIIWLENVPGIISNGAIEQIFSDLAEMGFNAESGCISAADCGADHVRERSWILAYSDSAQFKGRSISSRIYQEYSYFGDTRWGKDKSGVDRISNGMAFGMDRLKAIGNGQVPRVEATAFKILSGRINHAHIPTNQ